MQGRPQQAGPLVTGREGPGMWKTLSCYVMSNFTRHATDTMPSVPDTCHVLAVL
jgi:hypothetical protein